MAVAPCAAVAPSCIRLTIGLVAGFALVASVTPALAIKPRASAATPSNLRDQPGSHQATATARHAKLSHAASGIASFYRLPGRTSSGEVLDDNDLTAAHRTLPFNTRVKIKCASTGKSVVVRINDRGPFVRGRV